MPIRVVGRDPGEVGLRRRAGAFNAVERSSERCAAPTLLPSPDADVDSELDIRRGLSRTG
jgi:hypothetical protein